MINFLFVLGDIVANEKPKTYSSMLCIIQNFLTKLISDKKRIVRRAAAICKNRWETIVI